MKTEPNGVTESWKYTCDLGNQSKVGTPKVGRHMISHCSNLEEF